jgi:cell wall-associated NlpC family hydrolase
MDLNKYVGVPYKYLGKSFTGADCYGLVSLFYEKEFGISLPTAKEYTESTVSYSESLLATKPLLNVVGTNTPEFGDIGVFSYYGRPSHVGIYVGDGLVLHTLMNTASVIQKVNHSHLKNRLEGWYHYAK